MPSLDDLAGLDSGHVTWLQPFASTGPPACAAVTHVRVVAAQSAPPRRHSWV